MAINFVTDRTAEDVQRVAYLAGLSWDQMTSDEKAEWSGDMKGAYNANDLNRVESAVRYLAAIMEELPADLKSYSEELGVAWDKFYSPNYDPESTELKTKTDWINTDIPSQEDMERYLGNVITLRNAINYATDRLPTSMRNLTWHGANAIELALKRLDVAIEEFRVATKLNIENAAKAWYFSGDIYSGEV